MTVHPILAALRKHKAGVVLIALQIALTLAIVCNAVFIIGQRIDRIHRVTGLQENDLFQISQQWVTTLDGDSAEGVEKFDAMLREDLAALSALPGVASVAPINSLPLLNSSWTGSLGLKPGDDPDKNTHVHTAYYFTDQNALPTLGLKLVAGRDFTAADVVHKGFRDQSGPDVLIVTKAIADKLFPNGDAVGKAVHLDGDAKPSTIVGVVERMQIPAAGSWGNSFAWYSTLVPARLDGFFSRYAVRAKPGQLDAAMRAAVPALYKVNPLRVIDEDDGLSSFASIRQDAYRADVGMAVLMGAICVILIAVTAAGIVGLTSFWVGQRRKQIGVRRALGARKVDILRYFQAENLLIAGLGTVAGIALAIGLNLLLMKYFEMDHLPLRYVLLGVVLVLALGQAAVYAPARRASNVPPVEATRSV